MSNRYGRKTSETLPYFPRCIYSGNERTVPYEIFTNRITPEMQERYNSKYMKEECECDSCTQKRQERQRLINRLYEDRAYDSLRTLGVDV